MFLKLFKPVLDIQKFSYLTSVFGIICLCVQIIIVHCTNVKKIKKTFRLIKINPKIYFHDVNLDWTIDNH